MLSSNLDEYFKHKRKPVRTISGVTVVAVMSKPLPCPHGRCAYCPGGPQFNTPQSYYGNEPALMRAQLCNYDPYEQVKVRLNQYEFLGHTPSKVELIIMGGTFPALTLDYQEWFVTMCLEAMNRYPKEKPKGWISLESAQLRNEHANIRCVGMTFETRPDWAKEVQADRMLRLGGTRVELGVQTVFDDLLEKVERGHTVKDSVEATRILKDCGFKVCYHIMPGLPGSDLSRDLEVFEEIFSNENFMPDMLKIYPTIVVKGTKLYDWWIKGKYIPFTTEDAIELLIKVLPKIPRWVRIQRIQRDIPLNVVEAGVNVGHLRQLVHEELSKLGLKCNCIRCREVGHVMLKKKIQPDLKNIRLLKESYEASGGVEVFLSYEDPIKDILLGFLRLRIPSPKAHRWEIDEKTAIIRELHIYGPQLPIGMKPIFEWQHRGFGKKLLFEAERIALEEFDKSKMLILSGIGVRDYYRRFGYKHLKNSPYMMKFLDGKG
ncbi:MAG: tRNA uridine(34) 5-carboxymethylaminomethyl modification radical SAM/GNAT enzyme Elp3 [Candidatus Methanomethylicota archaeon]|nr:MAG: tRNA uridine(34) 5-carboxymethylaminomethyl modification radical SAM/GNAT enzyme Elp3 [Candidatus Verstraetearchaeota archaeon]